MHKIILCMCVFCARVWGMLRADEPESRKPNSGASSSKRRTSRADHLSSGRRGCLDVEPIGDGAKMFQARCASKHSAKSFSPVPLHYERAARRTKDSRSGTPREKETSPDGAGKAERGGTRPPSPRTGGEADEGQPKRRRAAWRRERTQHARTHNVCMSGIKDFGSNREVAFERWDYEKEP